MQGELAEHQLVLTVESSSSDLVLGESKSWLDLLLGLPEAREPCRAHYVPYRHEAWGLAMFAVAQLAVQELAA